MKFAQRVLMCLGLVIWASSAFAHSKMNDTVPAKGAVLETMPEMLELRFDKGIRVTRIVQAGPDGAEADLDLSGQGGFVTELSVPMAMSGAGEHVIEWRGLSIDGHAMQDEIRFTVTGP